MKWVIDERVKHRLIGVIVLLSIAGVFLPAVMKKSNQHLEEKISLSVRLPVRPIEPKIAVAEEKTVFQSVKVAHVDIPSMAQVKPNQIAKAEPISIKSIVASAPIITKKPMVMKVASIVKPAVKSAAAPKKLAKAAVVALKKEGYAVQLASFSQQVNAESLVHRLRSKGYQASYNKITNKQGAYYKVIVGQLHQRDEALRLQKKLASNMQLSGFIIKTGVS